MTLALLTSCLRVANNVRPFRHVGHEASHCRQKHPSSVVTQGNVPHTRVVATKGSSATGLRAGWWKDCAIPPRAIAVAALTLAVLCGHPAAVAATPSNAERPVDALVVRYLVGAPPVAADGRPWGAQCARARDRQLLKPGRWIGAGMRTIRLNNPIRVQRAEQIARDVARCPYIAWAEPEIPLNLASEGNSASI
jgi:hypothetical protein